MSLQGATDWHCHVLPGVDDGVKTMEQSLGILGRLEQAGVSRMWLTPHVMEDVPNTTAHLRERFAELTEVYSGPIELHLASENMIDNLFRERLAAGDLLPIGDRADMLLVETSYFNSPVRLTQTFEDIKHAGYFPLLAHPERYFYVEKMSTYKKWKDLGVRFQLNLLSLGGYYGPAVKKKAEKMLDEGMYDLAGSDTHHERHTDLLISQKLTKSRLEKVYKLISA